MDRGLTQAVPILRWREDAPCQANDLVALEWDFSLFLNGTLLERNACTPERLEELALGRLYAGGLINRPEQFRSLRADWETAALAVSAEVNPGLRSFRPLIEIPWDAADVMETAGRFLEGSELFRATGSVHSVLLDVPGAGCCRGEDVSRHNAFYKAVGGALRMGLPMNRAIVYTSGRFPLSMAEPVIRAGIPMAVSRSAPTGASLALAKRWGLTLAGFAHRNRLNLYTGF